ncbi:MAG: NAD-dependent epimerase/dehydratase family protein, partial [Bacteroidaceae bacterium]|nr:NAD-dependent epimerase/dehydratase family protein [Bacteroidaceae bacterium]
MTILVTGASGFIGSYIVEEGLRRGYEMWAGMRGSSSKSYLQDER